MHKQYHLDEYPIPEGFRIYRDRVPVMGVTMRKADAAAFCKGSGKQVAFERELNNRHDPNAIRIVGSWKGWFSRKEKMLGYVPAEDAAKLVRLGLADSVRPRLMKTYLGADGFVEIEIQIIGPKNLYETYNPPVVKPTSSPLNEEKALERLDTLTKFLSHTKVLSQQQLKKRRKENESEAVSRMLETGETYGEASGGLEFLNQPESDVLSYLKSIDNDLFAQVEIVNTACREYFKTGEIPAPYYPWRIAVILSKRKMKDREREFLAGWCRHFSFGIGGRYGDLVRRAEKLEVSKQTN